MRISLRSKIFVNKTILRFRQEFGERQAQSQQWFSYKLHWSDQRKSVVLVAGPTGLEQKDPSSNKVLATYFYKDIEAIAEVRRHNNAKRRLIMIITGLRLSGRVCRDKISLREDAHVRLGGEG